MPPERGYEQPGKGPWRTTKQWAEIVSAASKGAEVPNAHNPRGEGGFSVKKIRDRSDFAHRRLSGELSRSECRRSAGAGGKDTLRMSYAYSLQAQIDEMKKFVAAACNTARGRISPGVRHRWEELAEAMLRDGGEAR